MAAHVVDDACPGNACPSCCGVGPRITSMLYTIDVVMSTTHTTLIIPFNEGTVGTTVIIHIASGWGRLV